MNDQRRPEGMAEQLAIPVLLFLAGLLGVVWAGAQLAAVVSGAGVLDASLEDAADAVLALRADLGDPASAWGPEIGPQLPGPVLYWAATTVVAVVAMAVAVGGYRLLHRPAEPLDRRVRAGVAAEGRLATRAELAPLLARRPDSGRFVLGRMGRRWVATEDPRPRRRGRAPAGRRGAVMPVGPSRSGKTTSIINGVFHWPHPAVLVSLKGDFLDVTGPWRSSLGEVRVFDPSGVTGKPTATWSPLRAATTRSGAVRAARQMVEAAPRGPGSDAAHDFWLQMAESLLSALLVVAANAGERTFADVVRWVVSTDMPTENATGELEPLVRALKADGDPDRREAGVFAAFVLEGLWRNDHRTVSSVYATARTVVWPWIDPLVAAATSSCTIDLDWLLGGANTLYVCIPLSDQRRLRPVLGGLVNDLVGQAYDRFVRTNQPLDPPLLLVIDEAATLRPDQLPSWASTLAGTGVQLVTAWQSISQIDDAYPRQSHAILTNHLTKLFFPGMSDGPGLDYLSRLLGDEHVPSQLSRFGDPERDQSAVASVPLVPPAAIRQLRAGDALLVHGSLPPAHVRIKPWYRDRKLKKRAAGGR